MNDVRTINVTKRLNRMVVLNAVTASKWGYVTDVSLDLASGTVLALLFQTQGGKEYAILPEDFLICDKNHVVIAYGEPVTMETDLADLLSEGVKANGELIGSEIVTRDGKFFGQISEVFLRIESFQAIYYITSSRWQRSFGVGLYMVGNAPCQYSKLGARLIVPSDVKDYHIFNSLSESVEAWIQETAAI